MAFISNSVGCFVAPIRLLSVCGEGAKTRLTMIGEPRTPHFEMFSTLASCSLHFTTGPSGARRASVMRPRQIWLASGMVGKARQLCAQHRRAAFGAALHIEPGERGDLTGELFTQ
ncbi:hypothetical protein CWO90_44595 [Bradyrhizobium sp. Leo121]|nr:hypothetical protein CWO90_44595 [Bradyrhizobium sp. Leo121]